MNEEAKYSITYKRARAAVPRIRADPDGKLLTSLTLKSRFSVDGARTTEG